MRRKEMGAALLSVSLLPVLLFLRCDFIHCDYPAGHPDFMTEAKSECHFINGTEKVRYLERYFYNQEEALYFDSDVGYFIPKTEDIGRPAAEQFNKNKEALDDRKTAVDTFCKYGYGVAERSGPIGRRVEPSVRVSLMPHEDSNTEEHMLLCNVFGFFPSEIEVKWYRNGQEETGQVQSTELLQNGDWTFQIHVMLETDIQKGDTFTCEVHHKSLETPHRVDWHPQTSDSAKNKMVTGIVGFVLGAVFIIVSLFIYMRSRKVQTSFCGPQVEQFIRT